MRFLADLHIHSHFSIATGKQATLEDYSQWAKVKGIKVIGTGDFTHPGWFSEIREKLIPLGNGFFKLKEENLKPPLPGLHARELEVNYCLSAEISSIYKKMGKTRKIHSLIFSPDLETASRIRTRLAEIGNIASDGRPIMGLDPKDLLEIVLNVSPEAYLIPAHIWTPWFSLFGSKSGFDRIEDCFEEMTRYIFALETGLSSDPEMNWRWSSLDRYTLISNSDAHSPGKLGREANFFDCELSYLGMFEALKTLKGFLGTFEFFPEEGKYHLDGHRRCGVCLDPEETVRLKEICPVCGKKLTVGVMHRVLDLSDRLRGVKPQQARGYRYLIPLPEILSEITGHGAGTKTVTARYIDLISTFGSEFSLLFRTPLEDIKKADPVLSEALKRMREEKIEPMPGFDGQFGIIQVFKQGELDMLKGQKDLFGIQPGGQLKSKIRSIHREALPSDGDRMFRSEPRDLLSAYALDRPGYESGKILKLNLQQAEILDLRERSILVTAGPGTGKTRLLTHWIAHLVESKQTKPEKILAVTFTNKAALEMKDRLEALLGRRAGDITVATFHALCFDILKDRYSELTQVYDENARIEVLCLLNPDLSPGPISRIARDIGRDLEGTGSLDDRARGIKAAYLKFLKNTGGVDLSGLVSQTTELFQMEPVFIKQIQERFSAIAVDELQDINPSQYTLLSRLSGSPGIRIFAIGDPNQAIYNFRGSDVELFFRFGREFKAKRVSLTKNYRTVSSVLTAASALIAHNPQEQGYKIDTVREGGQRLKIVYTNSPLEEARYIASAIERRVGGTSHISVSSDDEGDYSFSDIAVLYRTNRIGRTLLPCLIQAGIPVAIGTNASILSESPFIHLKNILLFLGNQQNIVALRDLLLNVLSGFSPNLIHDLLMKNFKASRDLRSTLKGLQAAGKLSRKQGEELSGFFTLLDEIKVTIDSKGLQKGLKLIFDTLLILDKGDQEIDLKCEHLLDLASEFGSDLEGFLHRVELSVFESEGPLKSEKVRLMTFHAAKGLEFPLIFIAGAEEGIAPLTGSAVKLEEERRLFYVALTRAKDQVMITTSAWRVIFGKKEELIPSRFLEEIPIETKERIVLKKIEKKDKVRQLSLFPE